jgi:hypothetical protein
LLMVVILVAVGVFALGMRLRRWSLLAVPLVASIGVVLTLAVSGAHVGADNPAVFLVVLTETFLALGIVMGGHSSSRTETHI